MVVNATFNNISVISWRSVLLVEETGVPRENHRPVESHRQNSSLNVVWSAPSLSGIRTHNLLGPLTNSTLKVYLFVDISFRGLRKYA